MIDKTYSGLPSITVNIAGVPVEGFRMPDGTWVTSVSGMARVLNMPKQTMSDFLHSKWLKLSLGEESQCPLFSISTDKFPKPIVAIDTKVFSLAVLYYGQKGNEVAQSLAPALMAQALQMRFESAYGPNQTAQELVQGAMAKYPDIETARADAKRAHQGFIKWYKTAKYPGSHCHDYLTTKLAGVTAQEAREMWKLYAGTTDEVGLDHWQPHHLEAMAQLTEIKRALSEQSIRPKTETYRQAIDRACNQLGY